MISLDWDNITQKEAISRCKKILEWQFVKSIDLFLSPSGSGYHVYVNTAYEVSYSLNHVIRRIWQDDPKRLHNDMMYRYQDPQSVLFHYKKIDGEILQQKFIMEFKK